MMIAFSVASETRNLKHAYAMRARVLFRIAVHIFIGILLLIVPNADARLVDDVEILEKESIEETTTQATFEDTTTTKQSAKNRLVNIESLEENCKFEPRTCRCSGFNFDQPEETAFFELPTKVQIAPDGATYELGDEQHLDALTIENSTFFNFPLHLFYELPQLSELDMRRLSISHISWECFLAANKLLILLLADNSIVELGERTFSYASELQYLFLNNNKLASLHPDTFKGLQRLRHLDLSGNQLKVLPERLFQDLAGLQGLILAENQLSIISNDLFIHNFGLQTLLLHTNQLEVIGEYAFRSPNNLMVVDLSNNEELKVLLLSLNAGHLLAKNCSLNRVNIYGAVVNVNLENNHVQELYFSTSEALEHLVLRNNSLMQLATLTKVPNLIDLNVADNPQLGDLPKDWKTPQLQRLDLSNTGLLQLPLEALNGMPQLRKLNVSANKISEIDPKSFDQLNQLTHFYIHANDWNCFNLVLVMDLLILPNGMTYSADKFDADFPGAYIRDIACMYRLQEQEIIKETDSTSESSASVENAQLVEPNEVEKLRHEIKSVVQHFEMRLDVFTKQLESLSAKMQSLEVMNSSMWNQAFIRV